MSQFFLNRVNTQPTLLWAQWMRTPKCMDDSLSYYFIRNVTSLRKAFILPLLAPAKL